MLNAAPTIYTQKGEKQLNRVYWVQCLNLTKHLCKFLEANRNKLPTDLKVPAATAFAAVDAFCQILLAYDAAHARGQGNGGL